MAIRPNRLDGIPAYIDQPHELKRPRRQRLLRAFVKIPHDVALALASGAGTLAAQFFQGNEALAAIVPLDGHLDADLLDVHRFHKRQLGNSAAMVP